MKIWNGYGSEHSMNLVLIGRFKRSSDAEKFEKDIGKLSAQVLKEDYCNIAFAEPKDQRFSDELLALLGSLNIHTLGPVELAQLGYEYHLEREGNRITVKTDEADVSVFLKLYIEAGARVEVFSAHHYPVDSEDSR